jgi:hypothetical protein
LAHWNLTVLSVEKERRTSPAGCDLNFLFISTISFDFHQSRPVCFWVRSRIEWLFISAGIVWDCAGECCL